MYGGIINILFVIKGPTSPTIKCPTEKIEIQAPKCNADDRMIQAPKRNAGRIFLTSNITMVKAKSSEGKALQVRFVDFVSMGDIGQLSPFNTLYI